MKYPISRLNEACGELCYDRPAMSRDAMIDPPFLPPVMEVFAKALIVAEKENAPEIGVDHLLAALDTPTAERKPLAVSGTSFAVASPRQALFERSRRSAGSGRCACPLRPRASDYRFNSNRASRRQARSRCTIVTPSLEFEKGKIKPYRLPGCGTFSPRQCQARRKAPSRPPA